MQLDFSVGLVTFADAAFRSQFTVVIPDKYRARRAKLAAEASDARSGHPVQGQIIEESSHFIFGQNSAQDVLWKVSSHILHVPRWNFGIPPLAHHGFVDVGI